MDGYSHSLTPLPLTPGYSRPSTRSSLFVASGAAGPCSQEATTGCSRHYMTLYRAFARFGRCSWARSSAFSSARAWRRARHGQLHSQAFGKYIPVKSCERGKKQTPKCWQEISPRSFSVHSARYYWNSQFSCLHDYTVCAACNSGQPPSGSAAPAADVCALQAGGAEIRIADAFCLPSPAHDPS